MTEIIVKFISHHRKPKHPPNPEYPKGQDLNLAGNAKTVCLANLPYPAPECGVLFVYCKKCDYSAVITTAGRIDDPRTVILPCQEKSGSG